VDNPGVEERVLAHPHALGDPLDGPRRPDLAKTGRAVQTVNTDTGSVAQGLQHRRGRHSDRGTTVLHVLHVQIAQLATWSVHLGFPYRWPTNY